MSPKCAPGGTGGSWAGRRDSDMGRGAGDSRPAALWAGRAAGWFVGDPSILVLPVNELKEKKKQTGTEENKILVMRLANLSLGRAGKEADNWCAEQCHCVFL